MLPFTVRRRLIGIAFACGAFEHVTGFLLHRVGVEIYANYPRWRHPTLTVVDAAIAWSAFRHPRWLFPAVLAFLVEQVAINGIPAVQAWRQTGDVPWFIAIMHVVLMVAVIAARRESSEQINEAAATVSD